jgi:hypothetical protein
VSTTNGARLRQRAERLETPDKPVSTSAAQSVEAACRKFLEERGMIYKLTSYGARLVKKEASGNKTREADGAGQAVSMTIR